MSKLQPNLERAKQMKNYESFYRKRICVRIQPWRGDKNILTHIFFIEIGSHHVPKTKSESFKKAGRRAPAG